MAYGNIGGGVINTVQRRLGRNRGALGRKHRTTSHLGNFTSGRARNRPIITPAGEGKRKQERFSGTKYLRTKPEKATLLYDLKYRPDFKMSGHSANVTTGTIRTSEGTQSLETGSTFEQQAKKNKKRQERPTQNASILRRRSA